MSKKMKWLVGLWLFTFIMGWAQPPEETKKKDSPPSPNEILAKYLYEAKYSDFPPEAVKQAKYLILDSIGCALGGVQTELGHRYLKLSRNWGGGAEATIIGAGTNASVLNAAYVNTQMANLLDFDDTYDLYLPGHPGCMIIQTALALGQKLEASGEDILTAVILGYEISLRFGRTGAPILWQIPVGGSSIILGPAAASCKLLKLDPAAIMIAFRYTQSEEYPPTRWKHDYPAGTPMPEIKGKLGLYSMVGILAALQGQQGLTTNEGLLDGDLEKWFFAGGDPTGYDIITQGLGSQYRILEMSFKPTPSCRFTHVPITAAWDALDYRPVKNEDISEIIIKGVERLNRPGPDTMLQAQFSVPTVIALAITGVEPGPKWYLTGRYKDPDIVELAKKVKFENDPEAVNLELKQGKMMSTVKIVFKDGTVKQATSKKIKGSPENPLGEKELEAKFKANAAGIMSDTQMNRIIGTVMELEKLPRIGDLLKMLVSTKKL